MKARWPSAWLTSPPSLPATPRSRKSSPLSGKAAAGPCARLGKVMTDSGPTLGRAGPLGVLACAGPLPIGVAEAATRQGRAVHVVAIDGFAGDWVERFSHERVSIGE